MDSISVQTARPTTTTTAGRVLSLVRRLRRGTLNDKDIDRGLKALAQEYTDIVSIQTPSVFQALDEEETDTAAIKIGVKDWHLTPTASNLNYTIFPIHKNDTDNWYAIVICHSATAHYGIVLDPLGYNDVVHNRDFLVLYIFFLWRLKIDLVWPQRVGGLPRQRREEHHGTAVYLLGSVEQFLRERSSSACPYSIRQDLTWRVPPDEVRSQLLRRLVPIFYAPCMNNSLVLVVFAGDFATALFFVCSVCACLTSLTTSV